ncbi:MAG: rpfC 1 [Hyphomicrobiales bacterium]|nr:rpfC 1 [Hyphomicrobiales bacterium]
MDATDIQTIPDRVTQFRTKLSGRPDSEHELTLSRLALSLVAFSCLFIGYLSGGSAQQRLLHELGGYFLLYTIVTALLFAHLLAYPGISVLRRLIGIPLDIGVVAYLMHAGGEMTAFTYPIYLWAIFGNGFRFGVEYLVVAAVVGFASFLAVILTTTFWLDHPELSGGLLFGLVILPAYVSMLIRRLSEAKRQAEEASRAKSLFLASISHELRTPLNAVIGLSDILLGTRLERDQSEMARTIGKSGRSLLSLINSILDVSRMELGKKPQMGELDLHALLRDIRVMLSVQAQANGIRLALHIDPKLPRRIIGSYRHFEEVLINLTGNAVKFTSKGYVLVTARVLAAPHDGPMRLRFEVADTGIGIAPDAQARIFENFTQADETIIDRFGGTGLGLSIARQLVEAHGGKIGVDSKPGHGSTFWFEIEVMRAPALEERAGALPQARVLSRDSGLVEAVRTSGCPTTAYASLAGLEAALAVPAKDGELILVDERMLGVDGEAAAAAIAPRDAFSPRSVILLSANPGAASRDLRSFFHSVLPLPLGAESLRDMLRIGRDDTPGSAAGGVPPLAIVPSQHALDILVAEDNRTNQLVISQILTRGGHRPTIVDNGELAIDALIEGHFDLVFMDLNMPVLNGLDASKFYQFATLGQKRVPIIALTADATEETALKCREAGMADCLNKPIEAQRLLALVEKYAMETRLSNAGLAPPAAEPEEETIAETVASADEGDDASAPIDGRALRDLQKLGGDDFVSEIASQFVADAASVLKSLSAAVAEQDVHGFRDHAHALRSCAANVGAQAVFKICLDLRAIDAHELAVKGEIHVRELELQFERARVALGKHM